MELSKIDAFLLDMQALLEKHSDIEVAFTREQQPDVALVDNASDDESGAFDFDYINIKSLLDVRLLKVYIKQIEQQREINQLKSEVGLPQNIMVS